MYINGVKPFVPAEDLSNLLITGKMLKKEIAHKAKWGRAGLIGRCLS